MAKTNISFNNKNYSIPDESLSSASAALKSHLSTVMNGTGAIINLGGIAYSIDGTKLSAATTDFTSYLRAVAGTGYKVIVNGSEYNIDSTKLAGAVTEIEAVLGGLKTDGGQTVYEPLNITFDGNTDGLVSSGYNMFYKVSDWIPTDEQLKLCTITPCDNTARVDLGKNWDEGLEKNSIVVTEDYTMAYTIFCVRTDGAVFSSAYGETVIDIAFPEKGLYFACNPNFYVASLTSVEPIEHFKN